MPENSIPLPLEPGDKIRLNTKAAAWTRGLTFVVSVARTKGVSCYYISPVDPRSTPRQGQPYFAHDRESGEWRAHYIARWHEIEEPVK